MDKAITTALLIIVSMMMVIMLFNIAYPAVISGGEAMVGMTNRVEDRMNQQVNIIHITSELDHHGTWQDEGSGQFEVFAWVKNVGSARIAPFEQLDIFFGLEGNFARIPHQSAANGSYPHWTGHIENNSNWDPTASLRITINYGAAPLAQGRYFMKVVTPSGVSDDEFVGF